MVAVIPTSRTILKPSRVAPRHVTTRIAAEVRTARSKTNFHVKQRFHNDVCSLSRTHMCARLLALAHTCLQVVRLFPSAQSTQLTDLIAMVLLAPADVAGCTISLLSNNHPMTNTASHDCEEGKATLDDCLTYCRENANCNGFWWVLLVCLLRHCACCKPTYDDLVITSALSQ